MATNNTQAITNFSDMLAALESLGMSADDVTRILSSADREREAVAEANKILAGDGDKFSGKMLPEDSRGSNFPTVDSVREAFFAFATTVSETIVLTAGDPNGSQKRTRADKREVAIPTPLGTLQVRLTYDNE